jgi:excisionase family DNA binding protein
MRKLLTLRDTAELLSISPGFVKKLRRQQRLRVIKLGRAVRVSERELERLCQEETAKHEE